MMKNLLLIIAIISIISCNNDPRAKLPQTGNFGTAVKEESVKTVEEFCKTIDSSNNAHVIVTGVIDEVCKGEGCWLSLHNQNGEALFVEIENKAFILPRNIIGKTAVVDGIGSKETIKDEKKTGEITELKITAKGILIK